MTLEPDSSYVSMREAIRRGAEEDAARDLAEYQALRELETPEAEEARWHGVFRRMAYERPTVHYIEDRPGIDRRLHGSERP